MHRVLEQYVGGLQVTVQDVVIMQIGHATGDLHQPCHQPRLLSSHSQPPKLQSLVYSVARANDRQF